MSTTLGEYFLVDRLWGDDLSWWPGIVRLIFKLAVAGILAWGIHEGIVWYVFNLSDKQIEQMRNDLGSALTNAGIDDVSITLSQPKSPRDPGLAYTISSKRPNADDSLYYLYRLHPLGLGLTVTHPTIEDSIDVLLRRVEKAWKSEPGAELRLCAETRKRLEEADCAKTESARNILTGDANGASPGPLVNHLLSIRAGALLLGLVQWLTITVFVFGFIECVGLYLRWIRPRTYLSLKYMADRKNITYTQLETDVSATTLKRVRKHFDRFMEKGTVVAENSSREDVRATLRNFRDHLVEDAGAKQDVLDMLGDMMLKIAFMGTVYGIGIALYHARDLDAADPLLRLGAKAQMYAGIGLGFGATMLGIGLSVLAAQMRSWLAGRWTREIDGAWLSSSIFFDAFGGYKIASSGLVRPLSYAEGSTREGAAEGTESVVTPDRPPLAVHPIDKLLVGFGVLAFLGLLSWVGTVCIQMLQK